MRYSSFLIKYTEIAIKGKNRYLFEDALVARIKGALKKVEGDFTVSKNQGRIYVDVDGEYDFDDTVEALQCVFGISGICPVVRVEDEGYDKLCEDVVNYIREAYPEQNQTFKVNARRARKNYPIESMELNRELGGVILDTFENMKVDVHNPEIELVVEIRDR